MTSEYSPSELIGIPIGWKCKRLVDCTKDGNISYGIVQPGQYEDEGVPVIRVNNINDGQLNLNDVLRVSHEIESKYKRTRLRGGEVLLTLVGSTGQSKVVTKELIGWNVARAIAVIRPIEYIGSNWINICLQSKNTKYFLDVRANTTVQKTLNLKDVREIPILLPPKKIRQSIESIAMRLSEKIQLNQKINQTLEQIAQAIFKSWFVDFEPVKAKIAALEAGGSKEDALLAAMQAISGTALFEADASATNAEQQLTRLQTKHPEQYATLRATAELFPSAMQESDLGEIPEGWHVSNIDEATSVIIDHRGKTPKKLGSDWSEKGFTVLSAKHIKAGCIVNRDQLRFVDEILYKKWMKIELQEGDILLTSEGPMGEMYYLAFDQKFCLSQRLYALRADTEFVSSSYLFYWLNSSIARSEMEGRSTGTTVIGIRQAELRKVRVLLPSKSISTSFQNTVQNLLKMSHINARESENLAQVRDTLLPKLLSGELSESDLESDVAEFEETANV